MNKEQNNPLEIELLDLWNEVGGQLIIQYHTNTIKPQKEALQILRNFGLPTDIMTCIYAFTQTELGQEKALLYLQEAEDAGARPKVSFESTKGAPLHIKNKEENPIFFMLGRALSK